MTAGLLQQEYSWCVVCTQGCPHFTCISHLQWSAFFYNTNCRKQLKRLKMAIGQFQLTRHPQLTLQTTFMSPFQPTVWLDDLSHDFGFFSKQLDAPSRGMLVYSFQIQLSSYWISSFIHQFIFFISALTSSPTLDAKLCHIWDASATGCRVKLEVKTETKHRWV